MSFEEFSQAFYSRYPNCRLVEGIPGPKDIKGSTYISVCIGGIKHEDQSYSLISKLEPHDLALWEFWWSSFSEFAKNCSEIHVRTLPTVQSMEVLELHSFDHQHPTIVPVRHSQVVGRFSFHL